MFLLGLSLENGDGIQRELPKVDMSKSPIVSQEKGGDNRGGKYLARPKKRCRFACKSRMETPWSEYSSLKLDVIPEVTSGCPLAVVPGELSRASGVVPSAVFPVSY